MKNNGKIKGMYLQNCSYLNRYVLQRIKLCTNFEKELLPSGIYLDIVNLHISKINKNIR